MPDFDRLPSPALVLFRETMERNLQKMIDIAGGPERLRPHLKTHKLPQVLWRQIDLGIAKVKCATIAEAEMAALAGVPDILLAGQPVGANANRWVTLVRRFPQVRFLTLVDNAFSAEVLAAEASEAGVTLELLLDLDVGQHRTGLPAGPEAVELAQMIHRTAGLLFTGLHAYDGHLHQTAVNEREAACEAAFAPVAALRVDLEQNGLPCPTVVAGGTPTFPMHARRSGVECSPGTSVLWDAGYGQKLPDLPFEVAAYLFTRVISKPQPDLLCLDLGHKAVASEMQHPRVVFAALPDATPVTHNEEHLVVRTSRAADFPVGSGLLGIPWHVCPTVALHSEVWVLEAEEIVGCWPVVGRARRLSI